MKVLYTDKSLCRKSYACVRVCQVDAIGVQEDGTVVSKERCIMCGDCIDACRQNSIKVEDTISKMGELLASPEPTVLLLEPNWPIVFPDVSPMEIESALRTEGFDDIQSSFLAIEHVFKAYEKVLGEKQGPVIGSLCLITSTYVEKHTPGLIPHMAPVVTPAVATARYIRSIADNPVRIVLATSCLANKIIPETPGMEGDLDAVVTHRELKDWLVERAGDLRTESAFNYYSDLLAGAQYWRAQDFLERLVPGGESAGTRILAVSGAEKTLAFLDEVDDGSFQPGLAVVRYRSIETNSYAQDTPLTLYQRQDLMARIVEQVRTVHLPAPEEGDDLDLSRVFIDRSTDIAEPTPDLIQQILNDMDMHTPEEELDCGACGFSTCREKARAVTQGLAKQEMCFPYLIKKLSSSNEELIQKYQKIQKQLEDATASSSMIGTSPQIIQIRQVITKVAPTPTSVLIRGESGTGKELVARAIHRASDLADRALVSINCTAIAPGVLDSELFGHVKGSFTSANSDKKGLFEEADGGTIFLDEIGDISLELQAKLLRTLDSGEIRRVGDSKSRQVNVRLIAATNRDLERAIEDRLFREDLYYRLNTITIRTAPLRERKEDIPLLAQHLLGKACARVNKQVHGISKRAMDIITSYHWPGNVRELENVIERAVVLAPSVGVQVLIEPDQLPKELKAPPGDIPSVQIEEDADYRSLRNRSVDEVDRQLLVHYLKTAGGNVSKASTMAGIPRRTFYRMMDRLDLRAKEVMRS